MTRVAKAELLQELRRERYGCLLDLLGFREPMKRRFHRGPMDSLAAQCLANEHEQERLRRQYKRVRLAPHGPVRI